MAYQCPKCGAWNYPSYNSYGCECCGYNGTKITTSSGTGDSRKLKKYEVADWEKINNKE